MKEDPQLSRLLRETRQECRVPGDFQAQVWQKIALRSDQRQNHGLGGLWERFKIGILEPRYGYSLAVVVALIGFTLGQIHASAELRQARSSLEVEYVASIDPYAQSGHGSHR
jgi:hypothetical protein